MSHHLQFVALLHTRAADSELDRRALWSDGGRGLPGPVCGRSVSRRCRSRFHRTTAQLGGERANHAGQQSRSPARGRVGERRVNHFTFFAAFQDTREYRLRHAGKELGTLPLKRAHGIGDALIFAGRRWQIAQIDHDKLRVELIVASTGKLPRTGGSGMPVHDRVRKEMSMLLAGTDYPEWLDDTACEVLTAARCHYNQLNLSEKLMSTEGRTVSLFAWRGDATQDALVWLLRAQGLTAENMGICLRVRAAAEAEVSDALAAMATAPLPDPADILQRAGNGGTRKIGTGLYPTACFSIALPHDDLT